MDLARGRRGIGTHIGRLRREEGAMGGDSLVANGKGHICKACILEEGRHVCFEGDELSTGSAAETSATASSRRMQ